MLLPSQASGSSDALALQPRALSQLHLRLLLDLQDATARLRAPLAPSASRLTRLAQAARYLRAAAAYSLLTCVVAPPPSLAAAAAAAAVAAAEPGSDKVQSPRPAATGSVPASQSGPADAAWHTDASGPAGAAAAAAAAGAGAATRNAVERSKASVATASVLASRMASGTTLRTAYTGNTVPSSSGVPSQLALEPHGSSIAMRPSAYYTRHSMASVATREGSSVYGGARSSATSFGPSPSGQSALRSSDTHDALMNAAYAAWAAGWRRGSAPGGGAPSDSGVARVSPGAAQTPGGGPPWASVGVWRASVGGGLPSERRSPLAYAAAGSARGSPQGMLGAPLFNPGRPAAAGLPQGVGFTAVPMVLLSTDPVGSSLNAQHLGGGAAGAPPTPQEGVPPPPPFPLDAAAGHSVTSAADGAPAASTALNSFASVASSSVSAWSPRLASWATGGRQQGAAVAAAAAAVGAAASAGRAGEGSVGGGRLRSQFSRRSSYARHHTSGDGTPAGPLSRLTQGGGDAQQQQQQASASGQLHRLLNTSQLSIHTGLPTSRAASSVVGGAGAGAAGAATTPVGAAGSRSQPLPLQGSVASFVSNSSLLASTSTLSLFTRTGGGSAAAAAAAGPAAGGARGAPAAADAFGSTAGSSAAFLTHGTQVAEVWPDGKPVERSVLMTLLQEEEDHAIQARHEAAAASPRTLAGLGAPPPPAAPYGPPGYSHGGALSRPVGLLRQATEDADVFMRLLMQNGDLAGSPGVGGAAGAAAAGAAWAGAGREHARLSPLDAARLGAQAAAAARYRRGSAVEPAHWRGASSSSSQIGAFSSVATASTAATVGPGELMLPTPPSPRRLGSARSVGVRDAVRALTRRRRSSRPSGHSASGVEELPDPDALDVDRFSAATSHTATTQQDRLSSAQERLSSAQERLSSASTASNVSRLSARSIAPTRSSRSRVPLPPLEDGEEQLSSSAVPSVDVDSAAAGTAAGAADALPACVVVQAPSPARPTEQQTLSPAGSASAGPTNPAQAASPVAGIMRSSKPQGVRGGRRASVSRVTWQDDADDGSSPRGATVAAAPAAASSGAAAPRPGSRLSLDRPSGRRQPEQPQPQQEHEEQASAAAADGAQAAAAGAAAPPRGPAAPAGRVTRPAGNGTAAFFALDSAAAPGAGLAAASSGSMHSMADLSRVGSSGWWGPEAPQASQPSQTLLLDSTAAALATRQQHQQLLSTAAGDDLPMAAHIPPPAQPPAQLLHPQSPRHPHHLSGWQGAASLSPSSARQGSLHLLRRAEQRLAEARHHSAASVRTSPASGRSTPTTGGPSSPTSHAGTPLGGRSPGPQWAALSSPLRDDRGPLRFVSNSSTASANAAAHHEAGVVLLGSPPASRQGSHHAAARAVGPHPSGLRMASRGHLDSSQRSTQEDLS